LSLINRKNIFIFIASIVTISSLLTLIYNQQIQEITTSPCPNLIETPLSESELSEVIGLPIVVFEVVPDDLDSAPQVLPYVWYRLETPECALSIVYFDKEDRSPIVEIRVMESSSNHLGDDNWSCLNYDIDSTLTISFNSVCSNTIQSSYGSVFIAISTKYNKEVTRQIVEGTSLKIISSDSRR
jgi:hypothetical protein